MVVVIGTKQTYYQLIFLQLSYITPNSFGITDVPGWLQSFLTKTDLGGFHETNHESKAHHQLFWVAIALACGAPYDMSDMWAHWSNIST